MATPTGSRNLVLLCAGKKSGNDACWVENPARVPTEPPHSWCHMTVKEAECDDHVCAMVPAPQLAFNGQEGLLLNILSFLRHLCSFCMRVCAVPKELLVNHVADLLVPQREVSCCKHELLTAGRA